MPSARPIHSGKGIAEETVDSWPKLADVLRLNPEERTRFDARVRGACVTDEPKSPCWRPILVKEDLSRDLVAEIRQHESELAGAEIVSIPVRYYPFKNLAWRTPLAMSGKIDPETLAKYQPTLGRRHEPGGEAEAEPAGIRAR